MKVTLLEPYQNDSLLVDRAYPVLAIEIYEDVKSYRIYSERESPNIYPADLFRVVSHKIPTSWEVHHYQDGNGFDFVPAFWSKEDFWERYFDAEPEAVECFIRELDGVLEES